MANIRIDKKNQLVDKKNQVVDERKQLVDEKTKREALEIQALPRCKTCGRHFRRNPICLGHGSGKGGGAPGGGSGKGEGAQSSAISSKASSVAAQTTDSVEGSSTIEVGLNPSFKQEDTPFNSDVISRLLSDGWLRIENNRDNCALTFHFQHAPSLLPPEQKKELEKYLDAIFNVLEALKAENGISDDCYKVKRDQNGDLLSLQFSIKPALYDAFIKRLADKQLLPIQNIEQKANEKVAYEKGINHFTGTPFSMKPTPADKKKDQDASQHQQSSIRPKQPSDGLKPKGWDTK